MQVATTKIIPRIFGGIGNQLFCYAAARRLAVVNGAELIIDNISGFSHDHTYQRQYQLDNFNIPCRTATAIERLQPFSRVRRHLKRAYNRRLEFENRKYIQQDGMDFEPRLLSLKPTATTYLEGYWQSEDYFKDAEQTIRSDLQIKAPNDNKNLATLIEVQQYLSIAVHIRFFDPPEDNGHHNTSRIYYINAISKMEKLFPNAHYFIFSDRPNDARNYIPLPDERMTLISHNKGDTNAYADLWLMTQCQHFIIANSTFSWWGAWLGKNSKKVIITPSVILDGKTAWGFKGLIPETWIKI
ncbi:alpha-1,2-fucosyltransferase [Thiothrix sp.]|uniref:alpha-1,2-fucosyltransferase n=1 Tax=Thiothrix sp. TaxID=1032 RepID=UPI00257E30BF|nr:alpha-1,2-fucosyltransferase [Thiothrix sp.]